jgi:hypothetical protein
MFMNVLDEVVCFPKDNLIALENSFFVSKIFNIFCYLLSWTQITQINNVGLILALYFEKSSNQRKQDDQNNRSFTNESFASENFVKQIALLHLQSLRHFGIRAVALSKIFKKVIILITNLVTFVLNETNIRA